MKWQHVGLVLGGYKNVNFNVPRLDFRDLLLDISISLDPLNRWERVNIMRQNWCTTETTWLATYDFRDDGVWKHLQYTSSWNHQKIAGGQPLAREVDTAGDTARPSEYKLWTLYPFRPARQGRTPCWVGSLRPSASVLVPTVYRYRERVHTEGQLPISGVHSIMMEKSALAGEDGGWGWTPISL
jgi:hypothetical protein